MSDNKSEVMSATFRRGGSWAAPAVDNQPYFTVLPNTTATRQIQ